MKVFKLAAQSALMISLLALSACTAEPLTVMPMAPDPVYMADTKGDIDDVVPNQVLLKFRKGVSPSQVNLFLERYQARIISQIPQINVYLLELPSLSRLDRVIDAMSKEPIVEYVEANSRVSIDPIP